MTTNTNTVYKYIKAIMYVLYVTKNKIRRRKCQGRDASADWQFTV